MLDIVIFSAFLCGKFTISYNKTLQEVNDLAKVYCPANQALNYINP